MDDLIDEIDRQVDIEIELFGESNLSLEALDANSMTALDKAFITALFLLMEEDLNKTIQKQRTLEFGARTPPSRVDISKVSIFGYNLRKVIGKEILKFNKAVKSYYMDKEEDRDSSELMGLRKSLYKKVASFILTAKKQLMEEERTTFYSKKNKKVVGFLSVAILDSRTTPLCRSLHLKYYDTPIREEVPNIPPRHINCRSQLIAVFKKDAEYVKDLKEADIQYDAYLKRKAKKLAKIRKDNVKK